MYEHMNKLIEVGADIGGSHISAVLVDLSSGTVLEESFHKVQVDSSADMEHIISNWCTALRQAMDAKEELINAIGIAMPGPFDYNNGISYIRGLNKYESLYGLNVGELLRSELDSDIQICFENDAACFGIGEVEAGAGKGFDKVVAITLGTGFGGTFIDKQNVLIDGKGIPPNGTVYQLPFQDGIAEDYISARWLLRSFEMHTGQRLEEVREINVLAAEGHPVALNLFNKMGQAIGDVLGPWLMDFQADCLVVGGNIRHAFPYFMPSLKEELNKVGYLPEIRVSAHGERSAMIGAAYQTIQK